MSEASAEQLLIESVQRGDERAWRDLISRYQGRLASFARRMLADRDEAEDLVQDTFIGLLRSLPTFDGSRSIETYLFAILRHKLHDHFRRQRGKRVSIDGLEANEADEIGVSESGPDDAAITRESLDAQRAALVGLLRDWVERCQIERRFQELVVVEMLVVLGMRNKEVAADLDLTETAIAGVKFRVVEQWRKRALALALPEFGEADLARESSIGRVWRDEGVSCLKRSTLGKYLLGALDEDWTRYVEFHADVAGCTRCRANLDDLREEERADAKWRDAFREKCFASSVGFLSKVEH